MAMRSEDVAHHRQIVRDEEVAHAELPLEVQHKIQYLALHGHVQRAHWLIAYDHLRLEREGAGDADALPLAAAELEGKLPRRAGGQTHAVKQAFHLPGPGPREGRSCE